MEKRILAKFRLSFFLRMYPFVVYWISCISIKVRYRKPKNKYDDFCPTLISPLCFYAGWFSPVFPIIKCYCKHFSCQLIFMFDLALPNAGKSIDWWTQAYDRMSVFNYYPYLRIIDILSLTRSGCNLFWNKWSSFWWLMNFLMLSVLKSNEKSETIENSTELDSFPIWRTFSTAFPFLSYQCTLSISHILRQIGVFTVAVHSGLVGCGRYSSENISSI